MAYSVRMQRWYSVQAETVKTITVITHTIIISKALKNDSFPDWGQQLQLICHEESRTMQWLSRLPCPPASEEHPCCDNNSVPDLETARCQPLCHEEPEMLSPDAFPLTQPTALKHWMPQHYTLCHISHCLPVSEYTGRRSSPVAWTTVILCCSASLMDWGAGCSRFRMLPLVWSLALGAATT